MAASGDSGTRRSAAAPAVELNPQPEGGDISSPAVDRPREATTTDDYIDSPCPNNHCNHLARYHNYDGTCAAGNDVFDGTDIVSHGVCPCRRDS